MATDDEALAGEVAVDFASSFLVPGSGPVVRRLLAEVKAEWRRNSSKALRAAEKASGLSREDFAEWIADEPRAVPLYWKVLWAAGTNGHDKTLRAMGAVLGAAARATRRDDAEGFADAELALRAMADLTERHFHALAVIEKSELPRTDDGREIFTQFTPDFVAAQTGMRKEIAHQCLLNLAGAGLARQVVVLGDTAYPITDLGRAVVDAAAEVTAD